MAYSTKVASFLKIGGVTTQAITGVGFQPKALILWTTYQASLSTFDYTWRFAIAVSDGVTTFGRGSYGLSGNEVTAGVGAVARQANAFPIVGLGGGWTATVVAQASVQSLDADGFTLNWTTNDGGATQRIFYLALGGTDITGAKVFSFTPNGRLGYQSVSGVGFRPGVVLFFPAFSSTLPANSDTAGHHSLGVGISAAEQWSLFGFAKGGGARPTYTTRYQRGDRCIAIPAATLPPGPVDSLSGGTQATWKAEASFISRDLDGFTVNWLREYGDAPIYGLALRGGRYKAGTFLKSHGSFSQAIRSLPFQPGFLLMASDGRHEDVLDRGVPIVEKKLTLGAIDGAMAVGSVALHDADLMGMNSSQSNFAVNARHMSTSLIAKIFEAAMAPASSTTQANGTVSTLDNDGFTIQWANADALRRQFLYLMGAAVPTAAACAGGGAAPATTDPPASSPYENAVLADGPVMYLRLGESAGTVADDEANAVDGTYAGTPGLGAAGLISDGTSVDFDGVDDRVTVPDRANLDITTNISIEAWIHADSFSHAGGGDFPRILAKGDAAGDGWHLYVDRVAGPKIKIDFNGLSVVGHVSTANVATGTTYHVVVTYDGSNVRIYLNGVLDTTSPATGSISTNAMSVVTGDRGDGLRNWDGRIQEAVVYPVVLSLTQVEAHYALRTATATADASLASSTKPVVFVELALDSGTKRYAKVALTDPASYFGGFKEGRLLSVGAIRRAFSDLTGAYTTATLSITLEDTDRSIRTQEAAGTLMNRRVDVYAVDDADRRGAVTPRRLGSYVIRQWKPLGDLTFALELEDWFGSQLSEFSQGKLIPQRTFASAVFSGLPTEMVGVPEPIGYGSLSDEADGLDAVGVVPVHYTGQETVNGFLWDRYVVFGHAIKSIQSWFASDLGQNPSGVPRLVRMPTSTEGVDFLIPGNSGWNTHTGSSNTYRTYSSRRYTVIFARGPRSDHHKAGTVRITLNVCGIEATGDGTGTMIDALPSQLLHVLTNFVAQNYLTGAWLSVPSSNGYSQLTSVAAANATAAARLAGGYKGAFILGGTAGQITVDELMKRACQSSDVEMGVNRHGQVLISMENPAAAAVATWTDVNDIDEGGLEIEIGWSELANRVPYRYGKVYTPPASSDDTAREWLVDSALADSAAQAAHLQTRASDVLELWLVRDTATGDDVVAKVLARRTGGAAPYRGPVYATIRMPLHGTVADLGDNITVTHFAGLGGAGWSSQKLRVVAVEIDPETWTVTLRARKV